MKDIDNLLAKPNEGFYALRKEISEMADGYRKMNLLMTAVKFNLFNILVEPLSSEYLAEKIGANEDLTYFLCEALVSTGYLVKNNRGEYADSDKAMSHLIDDAPESLINRIRQDSFWLSPWNNLDERIRKGAIVMPYEEMYGPIWVAAIGETRKAEGLQEFIDKIESLVPLKDVETMMEVGPGHAYHMIVLCRHFPNIKPYFYDKPEICGFAVDNGKEFGVELEYQAGDYYEKPITGEYDFVLISFNPAGSDVALAPMVASTVAKDGYLLVRRHGTKKPPASPLSDLELNLRRWEGQSHTRKSGWGDTRNDNAGYDDAIIGEGFECLYAEPYDEYSELRLFRRIRD